MPYQMITDEEAQERNVKIAVWGDTGTRKTEIAIRHLPRPIVIDIEKNARHVRGMAGVEWFGLVETLDADGVLSAMQDIIAGNLKHRDGGLFETISIDSYSRLKNIRTDAATVAKDAKAQADARKWNKPYDPDKVSLTLQDRGKIAAPLKRMISMVAQAGVDFFVVVAREKGVWEEVPDPNNPNKMVLKLTDKVAPDGLNDFYEFNLVFHLVGKGRNWRCIVDKTQGKLGEIFSIGEELNEAQFAERMNKLVTYAHGISRTVTMDAVQEQAEKLLAEAEKTEPKPVFDKVALAAYKAEKGVARSIADDLKNAGLPLDKIDPAREAEYKMVVDEIAAQMS